MNNMSPEALFILNCRDPFFYIEKMWGLLPQKPKPEFEEKLKSLDPTLWEAHHFGDCERVDLPSGRYYMRWTFPTFVKGQNLTWQQTAYFQSIKNHTLHLNKPEDLKKFLGWISVTSGHGIGKSASLAMTILWFLFCYPEAQVASTAPSKQQMFDILWKEIAIWLSRMPKVYKEVYEWQSDYIRIIDSPESWFARAATARKENPEALAGVHGEHVLLVADEASGVEEVIFQTAEGATTGKHVMFIMISNPTRNTGFFKDSQRKDNPDWIKFSFSCEESPVVDYNYLIRMAENYDRDEDNFRVRVLGLFPHEDDMDKDGYMPLLTEEELEKAFIPTSSVKCTVLGVDPSGAGRDKSAWVGRNSHTIKILAEEQISTPISGSQKTLTLATEHDIAGDHIFLDSFGKGADWLPFLSKGGKFVAGVNTGDKSPNDDFLNLRAQGAWLLRTFIKNGGQIIYDERWKEVLNIRYRRTTKGQIQVQSKEIMKKNRIPSPNFFDAVCLTFMSKDRESDSIEVSDESMDAEMARLERIALSRQMSRFG